METEAAARGNRGKSSLSWEYPTSAREQDQEHREMAVEESCLGRRLDDVVESTLSCIKRLALLVLADSPAVPHNR